MTEDEANKLAVTLGLRPVIDDLGWCLLLPPGRALVGRGGTWEEAFEHARKVLADEAALRAVPFAPLQRELF